jgi:nicotinamide phosphoribosyltransferase
MNEFSLIDDINFIELTDSYKQSQWNQTPPGTKGMFGYLESRGGLFDSTCFFGLQYYIKKYLAGVVVTRDAIEEAAEDAALHFGSDKVFNRAGWEYILKAHGGRLPLHIKSVPEGTIVPTHNVLMTAETTDPLVHWNEQYMETLLSMIWYPTTVATQSREMKKILLSYLLKNGTPELIDFKLHDFGFRGSTSVESAGIGGMAHLVNFKGTDTLQANRFARKYYGERMAGFSIPAAEHSTITSWGRQFEGDALENLLNQYPTGLVSGISDSFDIYNACANIWGTRLKEKILMRDGTLVVRPDSGNPPDVVVKVLDILGDKFGFTVNSKGFKVLPPQIRVIQGDGIDLGMLKLVLEAMDAAGWSADNVAFGSGGGLLQKVNRDTLKFAFKCSSIFIDGVWHDVYKDPITDHGKRSKAGRLALVNADGTLKTVREEEAVRSNRPNLLISRFYNGDELNEQTYADVRQRAELPELAFAA